MKIQIYIAAMIAGVSFTTTANGQTADYVEFGEVASDFAMTITSIQTCKRMGFGVEDHPGVPQELTDRAFRDAVRLRVEQSTAEALLLAGLDRERNDMSLMSSVPSRADTVEELEAYFRDFISFWDTRCRSIAEANLGAHYVRVSGNEAEVQAALVRDAISNF